jgi:hypothetical protein
VVFHSWLDPGVNLSEGGIDEKMIKGSEGGFKAEVIH